MSRRKLLHAKLYNRRTVIYDNRHLIGEGPADKNDKNLNTKTQSFVRTSYTGK